MKSADSEWLKLVGKAAVYDLAQAYFIGMPHHPSHPPFLFSLSKKHGDLVYEGGASSASESVALGGHVGTHIDALCHFSVNGRLFDASDAGSVQSYATGIERLGVETIGPIFRRGVLLDVAGLTGREPLPEDFTIMPEHLEQAVRDHGVEVKAGDVVLLRTGWGMLFADAARFVNQVRGPGPALDAARWLSQRGIFAGGSDTIAFEKVPAPGMPVHCHFLVERGIHIIECLDLEQLAADRIYEFLFVAAPLDIVGATGAPVRPLAIVPPDRE